MSRTKGAKDKAPRKNPPKGLTGPGGSHNFPTAKLLVTDENREIIQRLLEETLVAYQMPKVKNDEELAQRIDDYFRMCASRGQIPTVEEMCLCTGYAVSTVGGWETGHSGGFSPETSAIIKKAKDYMKTFDAKLVIAGKQNPIVYFFRAKNYYGMVDKKEVVVTPNQNTDELTPEQLQQKYLTDSASDYESE